jgi:hypothetical protein
MALQKWVRLPSGWILHHGLKQLKWESNGRGSDNTASLMALVAIAHHADEESGIARLTYDALCNAIGLSRAKLSNGLDVLEHIGVITRKSDGRSSYKLLNFDPKNDRWGKLPAKCMYSAGRIFAFDDFRLRTATELNALKLFLLFVAQRDTTTNMANISFDKIEIYTGIDRPKIKAATSLLAALSMIYVEHIPSNSSTYFSNAYRVVGVDPYNNMGTTGRGMDAFDYSTV